MRGRGIAFAAAVCCAASLALAGCATGGGEAVTFLPAQRALCRAADQAAAGDAAAARTTFLDSSHDDVHRLAAKLEDVDRAKAAAMLEAKQRVEADIDMEPVPAKLADDLRALSATVASGLARLHLPSSPCER